MPSGRALKLLEDNPRVFWGQVIRLLIARGWNPPPPDERAVDDLLHDFDAVELLGRADYGTRDLIDLNVQSTGFTPAELRVITELLWGASNTEIAAELHVSAGTVKFHLGNIFRKAGVKTRTELVARLHGREAA